MAGLRCQFSGELKDFLYLSGLEHPADAVGVKSCERGVHEGLFVYDAGLEDESSERLDELDLQGSESIVPGDEIIECFRDGFGP